MSSLIKAAPRRRTCLLASLVLVPVLPIAISTGDAQQTPTDQLPPIEVNPPKDPNRTRARPAGNEGVGTRRAVPNVAQTSKPKVTPASEPSAGDATANRRFA